MTFAREAWPFVLPCWAGAALLFALGHAGWGSGALLLGLGVLLFFRNPRRRFSGSRDAVLAPADGRVLRVEQVEDPEIGPGRFTRVVTFLSVFDVHVQRAPVAGEVLVSRRSPGRTVAAYRPDAGEVNASHLTTFRTADGSLFGMRQIAGLVARRVVCYLAAGDRVERGQVMGLIKFGSRVDLLVPEGYRVLVRPGERLRNGASQVALPAGAAGRDDHPAAAETASETAAVGPQAAAGGAA